MSLCVYPHLNLFIPSAYLKKSLLFCSFSALALPDEDGMINPFAKKYRKSEEYSRLKADLDETLEKAKNIPVTTPRTYAINYFWQVSHIIV